jgi:hypothetical protein
LLYTDHSNPITVASCRLGLAPMYEQSGSAIGAIQVFLLHFAAQIGH